MQTTKYPAKGTFIDTRTPKEFEEDHIPGAINMPLLENDERAILGTIYKQKGQKQAVQAGLDIVLPKLDPMLKQYKRYKGSRLIIYCWRGGMRSKSVTQLLVSLGYDAVQLEGGYKAYRRYVLDTLNGFKIKPNLFILHGLTGAGKTDIIRQLDIPKLDLEDLAQHRSSMFGWVNLKPRTQKQFDSMLLLELEMLDKEPFFVLEGESRKIGVVQMPDCLWKAMKKGINIKVECSMENRKKRLVQEYYDKSVKDNDAKLIKAINKLRPRLSNIVADQLIAFINTKKYDEAAEILLEKYYDPLYKHTVDHFDYSFKLNSDDMQKAVKELKKFVENNV